MTTRADDILDLKGLNCPLPVLRTARAIVGLAPGATLTVEATDPLAGVDIPHFCRTKGHDLVSQSSEGAVLRFTIRKGG